MVWWEAVLSPALQVLFDKLASGDILELLRGWNINNLLLEKLKIAYFTCTVVIDDAEEKQYYNPAIQTWLDMLRDAVYEAEDALDILATEALRCKVELSPQRFSNQVKNWNFSATNFRSFDEGMTIKIENIIDKLEFIAKQKDILGLETSGKRIYGMINRIPTTPLLVESCIYGRENEKEEIIKLLLDDNGTSDHGFSVIPILGMGGIGKTTLAQLVYSDKKIDEAFDVKAWACVSDDFNVVNITKALVESSTAKPCDTMNLEILQRGLKHVLNRKRFLIVLDDVWNEGFENWNELSIPFMVADPQSRIIITTRNEGAVTVMKALPPYRLKEMSDPQCWLLFLQYTLKVEGSEEYSTLKQIGREIVKKCKGLPLAVKMLGALLASKLDIVYWNQVLRSNIWYLPQKENAILPSLRLSYHHLPLNLKRCFAYCSIFPKGYEFERKNLVLLWMAEGFVQPGENINMEEVGNDYFSELLSRSFFQESMVNRTCFVMHDLIMIWLGAYQENIVFNKRRIGKQIILKVMKKLVTSHTFATNMMSTKNLNHCMMICHYAPFCL
ncbi:hypothetical protein ACH5RR_023352 [Cinchona calisaya]|uniref:Disease resistance RPP13-like protein 1 n=1 Tax=Cinchona calisaya TaxID=153742 RepID=A0ABD2ZDV3_9GENT